MKDLLAVAKHPTTWGAQPYADQVFDQTATVLKKLERPAGSSSASWPWWNWPAAQAIAMPALR